MPYTVGQFLIHKNYPDFYYLITEATEQVDGNFTGEYFYRYVYMSSGFNRVLEPNEVLDQCFYSFQVQAANYSLATEIPEAVKNLAIKYINEKLTKWNDVLCGVEANL